MSFPAMRAGQRSYDRLTGAVRPRAFPGARGRTATELTGWSFGADNQRPSSGEADEDTAAVQQAKIAATDVKRPSWNEAFQQQGGKSVIEQAVQQATSDVANATPSGLPGYTNNAERDAVRAANAAFQAAETAAAQPLGGGGAYGDYGDYLPDFGLPATPPPRSGAPSSPSSSSPPPPKNHTGVTLASIAALAAFLLS